VLTRAFKFLVWTAAGITCRAAIAVYTVAMRAFVWAEPERYKAIRRQAIAQFEAAVLEAIAENEAQLAELRPQDPSFRN
jgi:membrane protein DedA with SNARE-associated domain